MIDDYNAPPLTLTPGLVGGAPLFLSGEDSVRATVLNAATAVRVQLSGRLLTTCGKVVAFAHDFAPSTDRTAATITRQLGEGWLLEASVRAVSGTPLIGQCYAILSIVRGTSGAIVDLSTIAAGYVTAVQRLAWPGSPIAGSLDGRGAIRSIAGAVPAAGAEISETVPTGARWELLSFKALLVTSGTVATRIITLTIDDGAALVAAFPGSSPVASQSHTDYWMAGFGNKDSAVTTAFLAIALSAPCVLAAGYRIRTVTNSIQVGDQYSAIQYQVREWIEGA